MDAQVTVKMPLQHQRNSFISTVDSKIGRCCMDHPAALSQSFLAAEDTKYLDRFMQPDLRIV
jgi:hypothetical protein